MALVHGQLEINWTKQKVFQKSKNIKKFTIMIKGNISSQWGKDALLNSVGTTGKPFKIKI